MLLDTFDDEERVGILCVGLLPVGSLKSPHKRVKGWSDTTGGVSGLADSCSAWDLVQRAGGGLLASRQWSTYTLRGMMVVNLHAEGDDGGQPTR